MQVKLLKMPAPFKIRFVEEADVVKDLIEKEYEKISSQIEVPGFRKGHVPRDIAEKQKWFNRFQMYKSVFDVLYLKAIEQEHLEVIDAVDFEVIGPFEDSSPLVIQATAYMKPKVLSFDISKVKAEHNKTEITDEMIENQLKAIQKQSAKYTNEIDENYKIKTGDLLIVDYTGRIDGKEFQGGSAKFYKYIVGETHFINGFEQQLVNLKVGEESIIKVTFPEGYQVPELRGKDAEFTTTISKIESCELKSIETLAFEKGLSVEDFKNSVKDNLVQDYLKIDKEKFDTEVLSASVAAAEIEPIPEKMIERELSSEWNKLLYRLGMTEEEYLKRDPNAQNNFLMQRRRHAEKTVEVRIFLDYICSLFDVSVTREEVMNYLKSQGEKLHKSPQEMDEIYKNLEKENNYRATENTVTHDKAVNILIQKVEENNKNAEAAI